MIARALVSWPAIGSLMATLLASIVAAVLWASQAASDARHTAETVRAHEVELGEQDDVLNQVRIDVAEIRVEQVGQGEQLDRIEAALKPRAPR